MDKDALSNRSLADAVRFEASSAVGLAKVWKPSRRRGTVVHDQADLFWHGSLVPCPTLERAHRHVEPVSRSVETTNSVVSRLLRERSSTNRRWVVLASAAATAAVAFGGARRRSAASASALLGLGAFIGWRSGRIVRDQALSQVPCSVSVEAALMSVRDLMLLEVVSDNRGHKSLGGLSTSVRHAVLSCDAGQFRFTGYGLIVTDKVGDGLVPWSRMSASMTQVSVPSLERRSALAGVVSSTVDEMVLQIGDGRCLVWRGRGLARLCDAINEVHDYVNRYSTKD